MRRLAWVAAAVLVVAGAGGCSARLPRAEPSATAPSSSSTTTPPAGAGQAAAVPLGQWAPVAPHVRLRAVSFTPTTEVAALRKLGLDVGTSDLEWLVVRMQLENGSSAKWDVASLGLKLVDPLGMALVDPDDEGAPETPTTLVSSAGESRFGGAGETADISVAFGVPKGTSPADARLSVSTLAVTGEYFALH